MRRAQRGTALLHNSLIVFVAGIALGMAALAGCNRSAPADRDARSGAAPAAKQPGDRTYAVRARLTKLPVPGKPPEIRALHEAIDDFADGQGSVVGMGAMDMEFPLAPGLTPTGWSVGDLVTITFDVWFDRSGPSPIPSWHATAIVPLPAGETLTLREARSGRARHTLRAVVLSRPSPGIARVRHEGIAGLLDADGRPAPLPAGEADVRVEEASAPALAPGPAAVELEVETWWTRGKPVLSLRGSR